MAANISQRKLQSIVLGSLVGEFVSCDLILACQSGCPRSVPMAHLPAEITVARLLPRLRCRTCGKQVARALLDNCVQDWKRWGLRVWGPGLHA